MKDCKQCICRGCAQKCIKSKCKGQNLTEMIKPPDCIVDKEHGCPEYTEGEDDGRTNHN